MFCFRDKYTLYSKTAMKCFLALILTVTLVAGVPHESYYDSKYDDFEVEELLNNIRLLKAYVLCFLGEGKCTQEGKTFKQLLPEAVNSNCERCTDKQKVIIARVMKAAIEKLPTEWHQLKKIHDPEDKGTVELNAFIEKHAHAHHAH